MLILLGMTASGKDTLMAELTKLGLRPLVSYTTRPARENEQDGVQYNFISDEYFNQLKEQDFFAETTSYKVASNDIWSYGTAKKDLEDDKVVILNPEGFRAIKQIEGVNPISIYLEVDEDVIWNRLRQRGDNSEEARRRLEADKVDFNGIENEVDFVFRNDLGITPEKMAQIVKKLYEAIIKAGE